MGRIIFLFLILSHFFVFGSSATETSGSTSARSKSAATRSCSILKTASFEVIQVGSQKKFICFPKNATAYKFPLDETNTPNFRIVEANVDGRNSPKAAAQMVQTFLDRINPNSKVPEMDICRSFGSTNDFCICSKVAREAQRILDASHLTCG